MHWSSTLANRCGKSILPKRAASSSSTPFAISSVRANGDEPIEITNTARAASAAEFALIAIRRSSESYRTTVRDCSRCATRRRSGPMPGCLRCCSIASRFSQIEFLGGIGRHVTQCAGRSLLLPQRGIDSPVVISMISTFLNELRNRAKMRSMEESKKSRFSRCNPVQYFSISTGR